MNMVMLTTMLKEKFNNIFRNEKGQGMVEYALILALVVIVGMVGMALIGTNLALQWPKITNVLK